MTSHQTLAHTAVLTASRDWLPLVRPAPVVIDPAEDVLVAASRILAVRLHCAPVARGQHVVGTVSVTGCARAVLTQLHDGGSPAWPRVDAVMQTEPAMVDVGVTTSALLNALMVLDGGILPVNKGGCLLGILLPEDLLRVVLLDGQEGLFDQIRDRTTHRLLNEDTRTPVGPALLARWWRTRAWTRRR
jgi:hypothetical protein